MSAATSAFSGLGTTLSVKVGSSTVYTPLTQLRDDAGFSGLSTTEIELPLLGTVVVAAAPGRRNCQQFTCSFYWVPADPGIADLLTIYQARTISAWQVQLPDGAMGVGGTTGSTATYSGFISEFTPGNLNGDDAPTIEMTIRITGDITFTTGT